MASKHSRSKKNRKRRHGPPRRKVCPFCADKSAKMDYKSPAVFKRFVTERGKIVPRRISGMCAKHQRELCRAVKRARHIALIPYSGNSLST